MMIHSSKAIINYPCQIDGHPPMEVDLITRLRKDRYKNVNIWKRRITNCLKNNNVIGLPLL